MGSFFSYTVEVLDDVHHGSHRLADFRLLPVAVRAARHALTDPRVSMALVRDRDGVMVFAADRRREWPETAEDARSGEFHVLHEAECRREVGYRMNP